MKPFEKPIYITRPMLPALEDVNKEIAEIWESQWLTNGGAKHQLLEEELKKELKVPHLSLFNNGTIALMVAVQSLRLSGEVITTPFTFPATTHVLAWNNITPVFCDIDEETLTLDSKRIDSLITSKTTGILGVHVYGMPCHVDLIQQIADQNGLKVVYDAAHAFNTEINGKAIGTFGDVSMFSFHSTKLFHTVEGGALTYNSEHLKQRIEFLKNFGIKSEEEIVLPGINGKMNEVQAAVGLLNLKNLAFERVKRKQVLDTYLTNLAGIPGLTPFLMPEGVRHSYQYFMVRISEEYGMTRNALFAELRKYNVFSRKYFYPLCSEYSCYKQLASANPQNLPVAHKIVKEVLCLPFYGNLPLGDVEIICQLIRELRE
jgi:dTDP-4-amino-4,6-dideoxygalactose transaminase